MDSRLDAGQLVIVGQNYVNGTGQDWGANVAVLFSLAGRPKEFGRYFAYGIPFGVPAGDTDSSGGVGQDDVDAIQNLIDSSGYQVVADLDWDGDVDLSDKSIAESDFSGIGLGPFALSALGSSRGFGGRAHVGGGLLGVRNRALSVAYGCWMQRDPMGYVDGFNLYEGYVGNPVSIVDPMGLDGALTGPKGLYNQIKNAPSPPKPQPKPKPPTSGGYPQSAIVSVCSKPSVVGGLPASSIVCSLYPSTYYYSGASASCFCSCAGNSDWSRFVRACLWCMYNGGVDADTAHDKCYKAGDANFERPWCKLAYCFAVCNCVTEGFCGLSPLAPYGFCSK